jgi:hypothetical protein
MGDAVKRTIVAVGAAVAFGVGVWAVKGRTSAMEFFTGYLIEESLSIDNIFVFIMLFDYFKVRGKRDPNTGWLTRISRITVPAGWAAGADRVPAQSPDVGHHRRRFDERRHDFGWR